MLKTFLPANGYEVCKKKRDEGVLGDKMGVWRNLPMLRYLLKLHRSHTIIRLRCHFNETGSPSSVYTYSSCYVGIPCVVNAMCRLSSNWYWHFDAIKNNIINLPTYHDVVLAYVMRVFFFGSNNGAYFFFRTRTNKVSRRQSVNLNYIFFVSHMRVYVCVRYLI